jgi:hypothetical protein
MSAPTQHGPAMDIGLFAALSYALTSFSMHLGLPGTEGITRRRLDVP